MNLLKKMFLLLFVVCFTFVGCDLIDSGDDDSTTTDDTTTTTTDDTTTTTTDDTTTTTDDTTTTVSVTDDFESYTVGVQLDSANSDYTVSADDSTTIARVAADPADSEGLALYMEDNSTSSKPTAALSFADGATDSGSVSVSVYIPADGYVKSTYIYLGGSDTGSSSNRYTEIVFGSSEVKFRDASGSQKAIATYTKDTWVDITIAWTGTAVTITIDDQEYTQTGEAADLIAENDESPSMVVLYLGDSSSTGTYSYFDDLDSDLF